MAVWATRRHRRRHRVACRLCINDHQARGNTPFTRRVITVSTVKVRLKGVYRVHYIRHRSRLANFLMLDELVSDGYETVHWSSGPAVHMDMYKSSQSICFFFLFVHEIGVGM